MVEREHLPVHPFQRLREVVVHLGGGRLGERPPAAAVREPALCTKDLIVPTAQKEVRRAFRTAMVDIEENVLPAYLRPRQSKLSVEHLCIEAQPPRIIFAKAAGNINVFSKSTPARNHLRIFRQRLRPRTLCDDVDGARRRRCTAVRAVVRHTDPVHRRIRPGCDVHALDDVRRRHRILRKEARNAIEQEVIAIHIDAAHRKI